MRAHIFGAPFRIFGKKSFKLSQKLEAEDRPLLQPLNKCLRRTTALLVF